MARMSKHLLVVWHTKTGNTGALIDAALRGAGEVEADVELRALRAQDAGPQDLLWAEALLLATPENFGYMSGAMKDFFDRTFYEVEGKLNPLPFALIVCAGNDGTGAVRAITRIAPGYPFVACAEPLIVRGEPTDADLVACHELGMTLSAGLDMGIF